MKYLEMNMANGIKDLHIELQKTLLNKWRGTS